MAVCYQGQSGEEWVIVVRYGKRLERTWEYSFYFECDLKLLVKATGVILFLGVGSLVCYRIYKAYWPGNNSPGPRRGPSSIPQVSTQDGQLLEDIEDAEADEIQGHYFGPTLAADDVDHASLNVDRSFPCSRSASGSIYPNSSTSQSDSGTSGEEEGRDADVSDGRESQGEKQSRQDLFQSRHQHLRLSGRRSRHCSFDAKKNNSGWLMDRINKILVSTPDRLQLSGNVWTPPHRKLKISKPEGRRLCCDVGHTVQENEETEQHEGSDCESNGNSWGHGAHSGFRMIREESYDSLGFSKRFPRDGSFDSTCSELSLDFSLPESTVDIDTGTMLCMEKLQHEIEQLKENCLVMDEEFETIKCNRNLPGMSSLMKANNSGALQSENLDEDSLENLKQDNARACFAGLYSLTTIKNSTSVSSELSDSFPAQDLEARGSIGSAESLAWDSPKSVASPVKLPDDVIKKQLCMSSPVLASEDELMANLEWDEEDLMEYPEAVADTQSGRSVTASPYMERSKMESSSGFESGCKMQDSCTSMQSDSIPKKSWTCWSSEESGCMEWDLTVTATLDNPSGASGFSQLSCSSEVSTPGSESSPPVENVGQKINVLQYAAQEWQGNTAQAKTILKGYSEIPSLLGLHHLRRIRGDNYCGLRAATFQVLSQGLPVPSGAETFQCLSQALNNEGCCWLQDWTFAGRLPYQGNQILQGMETCLRSLDNLAFLLSSKSGEKEDALAALLNCDPTLDLHIVEAVKLHMLWRAMQLHRQNSIATDEVPVFAMLLFARDTSETPRDLMNNHLREVGNTGGLEQIEMFLLGYTLGVTLRVVRPTAYGTEDFVCSYPDLNEGNWPQVVLIAEDDRHYNVLVN